MGKPLINDRYRILSVIRKGSQATLYRALDEWMGKALVALTIYESFALTSRQQKSVLSHHSPMEILKRIRHSSLIPVLDWGVTDKDHLFHQMALPEKEIKTLNQTPLSTDAILKCIIRICNGLNCLHSNGVVHGNLTPYHLLWQNQSVKLFGYGTALHFFNPKKMVRHLDSDFTAPEVFKKERIDIRCDLYSLGAVFFSLITGHPPTQDLNQLDKNETDLTHALEMQYEVSPHVKEVIQRLLEFDPEKRYKNARETIQALGDRCGDTYIAYSLNHERGMAGIFSDNQFIGRKKELKILSKKLRDDHSNAVILSGKSGIGKSDLLWEFTKRIQADGGIVAKGLCIKEEGVAYRPMREILRQLIKRLEKSGKIASSIDVRQAAVLAALLPELWEWEILDGFEEPAKIELEPARQRLNSAIYKILSLSAEIKPILVVIEDLQWADEATVSFLNWLSTLSKEKALLICITCCTPSGEPEGPFFSAMGSVIERIPLTPLSLLNTRTLIGSILDWKSVPKVLYEKIHGIANGNIFFVKSLIRYFAEDGYVIQPSLSGWRFKKDAFKACRISENMQDLMRLVILSLSEKTQQILKMSSVIGSIFWDDVLIHISGISKGSVRYALNDAVEKGLIVSQKETVFKGSRTFIFMQSEILQQCYEMIPEKELAASHKKVAHWLKKKSHQRADEYLGMIADHFERAGLQYEAMNYLMQAGAQVAAQFAHAEAMGYLVRALNIAPVSSLVERYTILLTQDDALNCLGHREDQKKAIDEMASLAEMLDDDQRRVEVMTRKIQFSEMVGDNPEVIAIAQKLIALSDRIQSVAGLAEAYFRWGGALWRQGDYKPALPKLERSLTLVRATGFQMIEANTLRMLGNVYHRLGNYTKTMQCHQKALQFDQKNDDPYKISVQTMNIALIFVSLGDYESGKKYFSDSLQQARRAGIVRTEMFVWTNWAELETLLEDFERALIYANE